MCAKSCHRQIWVIVPCTCHMRKPQTTPLRPIMMVFSIYRTFFYYIKDVTELLHEPLYCIIYARTNAAGNYKYLTDREGTTAQPEFMVATLHVGWPMKWSSSADEAAQFQLCAAKLEFLVCAGKSWVCANSRFALNMCLARLVRLNVPENTPIRSITRTARALFTAR